MVSVSPLQNLAKQIGLEGSVQIPSFMGFPAHDVEKIHLLLLVSNTEYSVVLWLAVLLHCQAVLTYFFGWRVLLVGAVLFFISGELDNVGVFRSHPTSLACSNQCEPLSRGSWWWEPRARRHYECILMHATSEAFVWS